MYSQLLYVFSFLLTFYFLCSTMSAIENVICSVYCSVQHVSDVTCRLLFS